MNFLVQTNAPMTLSPRLRREPARPRSAARRSPRIGIALSGGGMKGAAHIGVLSALVRAGLKFDMLAGTSAGALMGLFFCDGYDPESMSRVLEAEFVGGWWWRCMPFGKYWRLRRLLRGGGLKNIIRRHIRARRFEDLAIPFFATSTDLVRGEEVIHERGELVDAVQASMSIPGLTPPVRDGDRLLVDGGLLTYLPTEVLRERGADIVIGVDLSADKDDESTTSSGAVSVFCQAVDLQNRVLQRRQLAAADVIIRPRLPGIGCADFSKMQLCFDRGEEAGAMAVARIRELANCMQGAN